MLVLGIVVLTAGMIYANYSLLSRFGKGGEFLTYWSGARAFIFEGRDPYSLYVPLEVQSLVYGRPGGSSEKPYILDMPFHLLVLFFPFGLIKDSRIALAVFRVLLEVSVFWVSLFSMRLARRSVGQTISVSFILFNALNLFMLLAILQGSISPIFALVLAGILVALRADNDELAGALVALIFFEWQITLPFIIFVILHVIRHHRWRVLAGFSMATFVLWVISFFLYPGWVIPFLRAIVNDLKADYGMNTHQVIAQILPGAGEAAYWGFLTILLLAILYEWYKAREYDERLFYWTTCLTLCVTPLISIKTELHDLTILVLPAGLLLAVIQERWHRSGKVISYFLMILLLVLPWAFYLKIIPGLDRVGQELIFLSTPLLLIGGLYWMRWWSIRPPRSFLERTSQAS